MSLRTLDEEFWREPFYVQNEYIMDWSLRLSQNSPWQTFDLFFI